MQLSHPFQLSIKGVLPLLLFPQKSLCLSPKARKDYREGGLQPDANTYLG